MKPMDESPTTKATPNASAKPAPSAGGTWSASGGNARRTGFCATPLRAPLAPAWTFGGCGRITNGIAASGSTAVFADRTGKLFGVDVRDGRPLWDYALRGLCAGTPAILGDRVFAGSSALTVCVDLRTGEEVWASRTRKPEPTDDAGDRGACTLCAGERVFVCDERLAIFHTGDGRVAGNTHAGFEPRRHTGACSYKDFVYLPTRGEIRRLSLSTGTVDGIVSVEGEVTAGPIVAGGLLVFGTNRSTLEAVKLGTLARAWVFEAEAKLLHEGSGRDVEARPAFAQNRVFFGAPDGCVYALKSSDGTRIWRHRTHDRLQSPPVVCGDTVYVLASKGEFCALSAADGRVLWSHNVGKRILSASCAPAVIGNRILVGWDKLYAFEPGT